MVVLSVLVVWVHLLHGLLSDGDLCGRSSVSLRCVIRCIHSGRVSLVVATYASFRPFVAVSYSWASFCPMCSLLIFLALVRLGWMHDCTCIGVPLLGSLVQ